MASFPWFEHYPDGVPETIDAPDSSVFKLLADAASADPKAVATGFMGATMTYGKILDQVLRTAEHLRGLGVRPGDRVAIILPNCPQHMIAFYAVARLGAIAVEHNPLYTARELRHMFEDHASRVAICWDADVAKLRAQPHDIEVDHIVSVNLTHAMPFVKRLAMRLPVPKLRRLRKQLTASAPHTIPWKKVVSGRRLSDHYPQPAGDDLALIQYTSGTTAQPKGAMLTHRNLYANVLQARAWLLGMRDGKETFYAVLPLFHSFGMTLNMTMGVLLRARVELFPNFDPSMVLASARRLPPTVLGAVPPIFGALASMAKTRHVDLSSTKFCFSGAMKLTSDVAEMWDATGAGHLVEGYGMTEAAPVLFGNPLSDKRRLGTIGVPFPSVEAKVVDPNDISREMPPGERGELLVRGPNVFAGYWNNPVETANTLLADGWLRTGDIVTMEADGFTTLVDRVKELIITGGFNVAPTEVEAVLRGHPSIADIAVVGVPDPRRGEMVAAAVVLRPEATLNEDDIRAYAKQRLTNYKVPRRVVAVDDLPKSLLGKVLRAQVRDELIPRLEQ